MKRGIVAAVVATALITGAGFTGALPGISTTAAAAAVAGTGGVRGCGPNGKRIPTEFVDKKKIPDVDLDGRPDTLVHWLNPNTWGVKTAAGAVITVKAPDAHPKRWHGWAYQLEADPAVMVVDDGKQANPYYLLDCRFVRPKNTQGHPYVFSLYPHDGYGTGVTCVGSDRGGYELAGVYAVKQDNDRYRIQTTIVSSRTGRTAKNGPVHVGQKYYKASSKTVKNARRSTCPKTPLISGQLNGGK